jgi:pimeloyl-ACP methyl ester carboxylesterase
VQHRYVDVAPGVTIHVADAGPADGPPVMLVHGFPQNWWEWNELIGPLAASGHRVLCPDLRGAGWSTAPRDRYRKNDMADDLAAVLDQLGVGSVKLVAHDWGGPVAAILMMRHPAKVTGFVGLNTIIPWLTLNLSLARHAWRFWYQILWELPVVGPLVLRDPKARYLNLVCRWVGAGRLPQDQALYADLMRRKPYAVAGSRWYRTFQTRETARWLRGEFDDVRIDVPVRFLHGMRDPVITPNLMREYPDRIPDYAVEYVDGASHWIVEERPELVLERLRSWL